jgi:hypothetical protein
MQHFVFTVVETSDEEDQPASEVARCVFMIVLAKKMQAVEDLPMSVTAAITT